MIERLSRLKNPLWFKIPPKKLQFKLNPNKHFIRSKLADFLRF